MIRDHSGITIGRDEPRTDETRLVHAWLDRMLPVASRLYRHRWPDRFGKDWSAWQTTTIYGWPHAVHRVDFAVWDGLGTRLAPLLSTALRWTLSLDKLDPVDVAKEEAPILPWSHRVLPNSVQPKTQRTLLESWTILDRVLSIQPGTSAREFAAMLDREGIIVDELRLVLPRPALAG